MDGWVAFDGDEGPKRLTFDTRRAVHPTEKPGERLDPGRLSGFVVVAMKKLPAAEWDEYEVKVEQRFVYEMSPDARATYTGASQMGKVRIQPKKDLENGTPRTASVAGNTVAALRKYVDGKPENWFELRPVSPD